MMKFRQFVSKYQLFYESFGNPIHPTYLHEAAMIKNFMTANPLLKLPGDLVKWCMRFVLNKTNLILKNMSVELIVNKLREVFPGMFVVYTPETSKQIIIRIYFRHGQFKKGNSEANVKAFIDTVLNTTIRGVDRVLNTQVIKLNRTVIAADGSVKTTDEPIYAIQTTGTNLAEVVLIPEIDPFNVQSDSIIEMQEMFGIEAARQKIVTGMRWIGEGTVNIRHLYIYADDMTSTGVVTSVDRSGASRRETNNWLLRIGFSSPTRTLEQAMINSGIDLVQGVTAPLLVGACPRLGTMYNQFMIDEDMIRNNTTRANDLLDQL
jgi:DNA-directed RNA polymerase beta' subunit